jgi:hypothetical protein
MAPIRPGNSMQTTKTSWTFHFAIDVFNPDKKQLVSQKEV